MGRTHIQLEKHADAMISTRSSYVLRRVFGSVLMHGAFGMNHCMLKEQ